MNNILFLDLSSKSTGYAVADQQGNLLDYGCITASSSDVLERIEKISNELVKIFTVSQVQSVVAEEVRQDRTNNHTTKILTWMQGIVLEKFHSVNKKMQYEFIQPSSWRSKIGIKTGAGIKREQLKKEDINYVKQKYNLDVNDDVADAIGIMDAYFVSKKKEINW